MRDLLNRDNRPLQHARHHSRRVNNGCRGRSLPRDVLLEVLDAGEEAIPGVVGYVLDLRAFIERQRDRLA
ncbi:MAG: hypothetical protein ACE5FA_11530 [Dehalococcoidia bacterium]